MNKSIKIIVSLIAMFAVGMIVKSELYNYKFHEVKQMIVEEQSVNVTVSIKHNGHEVNLTNDKQAKYPTASVVKMSIIAQLMHKYGNLNNLTADQIRDTKLMMEQSNNDATTRLLIDGLGSKSALKEIIEDLGLKGTKVNSKWGLTQTTSKDQLKILDTIFDPDNQYLTISSKEYIKKMMNNVALDQNWGITSGSDVTVDYVKNGWAAVSGKYDPNKNKTATWIINSNGQVKLPNGETYTISILTNGNRSKESGIELVNRIGTKVYQILNEK